MSTSDPIACAMDDALDSGVFPGAVLLVRLRGEQVYGRAFGLASRVPAQESASLETIYDLASLTKPLATTGAILCLVQDCKLRLDTLLEDVLDGLDGSPMASLTVQHLLNHSSGLPAWKPYYKLISDRDKEQPGFLGSDAAKSAMLGYIAREPLVYESGTRSLYSDLGFILLGLVAENVSGLSLASFCRERVFAAAGANPIGFLPNSIPSNPPAGSTWSDRGRIAPTEDDPWRGRLVQGEVHDENAFAMGGIAGHAGLFGTATAVLAVSGLWLSSYLGRGDVFEPELARRFVKRNGDACSTSWALGWDTPSGRSSSGTKLSPVSFGHLGYTGTSLWVDPTCELEVVLLSNRVHPSRENTGIKQFRPVIHDVIYEELVEK